MAAIKFIPTPWKKTLRSVRFLRALSESSYDEIGDGVVDVPALGLPMRLDMRAFTHRGYLLSPQPEQYLIDFLSRHLHQGQHAFDVGAFVGFYTLLMAKIVGPKGSVTAFEPVVELAERIEESASLNGFMNVTVERCAVSRRSGESNFHLVREVRSGAAASTGGLSSEVASGSLRVRVIALDDFVIANQIDSLDLVKIDIEGAETDALVGMERTLASLRPWVVMEVNDDVGETRAREILEASRYGVEVLGSVGHGTHLLARPRSR